MIFFIKGYLLKSSTMKPDRIGLVQLSNKDFDSMSVSITLLLLTAMVFNMANSSLYRMERGSTLQIQCPDNDDISTTLSKNNLGKPLNPANSCKKIKESNATAQNGLYHLTDQEGNLFTTYCDMNVGGGGWTLVASVHENNMKGRCTSGDRWSSEQGNSAEHPHGDGFWENRAIHGSASSSTSDDYKNFGYFGMIADDVMIWHVPNDTPLKDFEAEAFLKYYTMTNFLSKYEGNLQSLFSKHYPMRSKTYTKNSDNGPAIPVTWAKGNNAKMVELTPPNSRGETDAGYIQFRAVNYEQNAFALCPGVRNKPTKGNVEHVCIGSTSYNIGHANEEHYCGDFAAKDWYHSGSWSAPEIMQKSVVMIFYR